MTTYSHAPENYLCPFCGIAKGNFDRYTQHEDVIYQDDRVTAFIASHWWQNNPGHVLVIPNRHIENIYDLTPDVAIHVYEAARQVAIAFKQVYGCDGTSTRQHNEPAGYQDVWHFHLHVFPRYYNDQLYELSKTKRRTTLDERRPYAEKLRRFFDGRRIAVEM
jgi:histidine triad (HIT) family protein